MQDLEDKINNEAKLEIKRRLILEQWKKGKTIMDLALIHDMHRRSIEELLKICISFGYIKEEEYRRIANQHKVASFKRGVK